MLHQAELSDQCNSTVKLENVQARKTSRATSASRPPGCLINGISAQPPNTTRPHREQQRFNTKSHDSEQRHEGLCRLRSAVCKHTVFTEHTVHILDSDGRILELV